MKKPILLIVVILFFLAGVVWAEKEERKKIGMDGRIEEAIEVKKWCKRGIKAQKTQNYDEAIACYKEAIDINPNYALAYHNLGYAYYKKGLNSLAADHFYKAGLLHLEQGNRDNALKAYEGLKLTKSKKLEHTFFEKLYPEKNKKKSEPSK